MTAEQLEAARAERMRQNGHGATTIEDVRTWIEETGLCIFLPRSAQAGFTAPTFVEAVAGERTTEPTLELIATAEALLVRLEAEGVAVRLNLAGQPGDQPDYVVAGWVLPYIYALRGDRDWRRSPQLTGSRQVSPLAVQVAKHLDSANLTAIQLRDALGRETTEAAVLRALHELWKQLRVIPVVPEVGKGAAWQPLRQRFQKAIAEGASTSQVTAISVLASIYLQAVIASSMEDVEMFLAPLTSRSKIREVVRGLAATRQVHSTTLGHGPMYYVAGTLPDFPAVPSYQSSQQSSYRSSGYRSAPYSPSYLDEFPDSGLDAQPVAEEASDFAAEISASAVEETLAGASLEAAPFEDAVPGRRAPLAGVAAKPAAHRPRPGKAPVHPRGRTASSSADRRSPAPRTASSNGARPGNARSNGASSNGARSNNGHASNGHSSNGHSTNGHGSNAHSSNGHSNGNGHARPNLAGPVKNGAQKPSKPAATSHASNGRNGAKASHGSSSAARTGSARPAAARSGARPEARRDNRPARNGANGSSFRPANGHTSANGHAANGHSAPSGKPAASKGASGHGHSANGHGSASRPTARPAAARPVAKSGAHTSARPTSRPRPADAAKRTPASASASKRYGFAAPAKQAPKSTAKASKPASASRPSSGRPAASKRRG